MEDEHQQSGRTADNQKEKFVIKIPSYQEVIGGSEPKTTSSSSLFNPSPSFSQAFNSIKNSDFYSPPPPPAAPSPPPSGTPSRHSGPLDTPSTSSSQQPTSASSSVGASRNAILVSHRQKGNPLLKYIRNVRWAFAEIVSDYQLGQNACAIYLSLRYHLLHPDYLYFRIRELQKNFRLRVVLCYVDVEDVVKPLLEVTKTSLLHECTLLCGWSLEECGRYLETIKVYENKPADLIQGQMDTDYLSRLNHALTTIRHVNKTDVVTLGSTFGSLMHIIDAPMEDLARCPGIGEQKVRRLYDTFHEPFKRVVSNCQPAPETAINNNIETSSISEKEDVKEENESANKRRKKEPELTVKSALTAAFAKYSDRVGRNKNKVKEDEETNKRVTRKKGSTRQENTREEATTSATN